MARGRPPRASAGIALILVLWVLTLLAVMAIGLTAAQRTETALAENQIDQARFMALSDAAIAYAMYSFLMPADALADPATGAAPEDPEAQAWVPNGAPRGFTFAGSTVEIAVFNEGSRINLNTAEPALLAALFEAAGVVEEDAATLADAVADFRDADDLRLLNGAEDDDYADAGRALGAKDEPFTAVEELQQVLGVDRALYQQVAPALTVDAPGNAIDQAFAPALVLAALQGIPLEDAELQVAERDDPLLAGTQGPRAVNRGGPLYRVAVGEQGAGGPGRRMEALVELAPGPQGPYRVVWRRLGASAPPPAAGPPGADDDAPNRP
jgi:general secretion pathway protein K